MKWLATTEIEIGQSVMLVEICDTFGYVYPDVNGTNTVKNRKQIDDKWYEYEMAG